MPFAVEIKSDKLENLTAALAERILDVVKYTALEAEAAAKMSAPFDTGALRNSIYLVTPEHSGYEAAAAAAAAANPKATLFPSLEPSHDLEALLAVGVNYGTYLEYGTSRAGAQPFFIPAVLGRREAFRRRMAKAFRDAAAGAL